MLKLIRVIALDERPETLELMRKIFLDKSEMTSPDIRDAAKQTYEKLQSKIGPPEELQSLFENDHEVAGRQNELAERIDLDSDDRVRTGSFIPIPIEVEAQAIQKIGN